MRIKFSHAFLTYARPADRQTAQCTNLTGVSLPRAHLERRMALQRPNAQFRDARVARREEPRLGRVFGAPCDDTARARFENGGKSESFSLRNAKKGTRLPENPPAPKRPYRRSRGKALVTADTKLEHQKQSQ